MILTLPILVPLFAAALSLAGRRSAVWQRGIALVSAAVVLVIGCALFARVWSDGNVAVQLGGWTAPYGITLVADLFSAVMIVLAAAVGAAVLVYSLFSIPPGQRASGYFTLVHVVLAGVSGAFLTGDLFNLYVWFEVLLIASFVLLGLGAKRAQMEGAIKYVTLNLVSSAFFLAAAGILYANTGTLNMADLAAKTAELENPAWLTAVAMLFMVAFGIKAAVFPLFFWLPASYHVPLPVVSALFAGLLTKVGVYALFRVFTLIFHHETGITHGLLLVIAGLTMVTGVFGAVVQTNIRRILAFHSISQIGYMILGLALLSPLAVAASILFIVHHGLVKTNLFFISGLVRRLKGTEQLQPLGGLYESRPLLAGIFLATALSLAGLPPFSGFFAKLGLVRAGLEASEYLVTAAALAVSLLTLYSMTKIWNEAFWKLAPEGSADGVAPAFGYHLTARTMLAVSAAFAALAIGLGLGAGPAMDVTMAAAHGLLDTDAYIEAVLGARTVAEGVSR